MTNYHSVWASYLSGKISVNKFLRVMETADVHGALAADKRGYIGYDYNNQCWVELNENGRGL
jgi:hypothetical protein